MGSSTRVRRLKLTLEFDGAAFYGWQVQTRTGERTVQGVVQGALASLPGQHSKLRAAGRTDTGVHALAMVAHVDTDTSVPDAQLRRALNAHLPADVRVLSAEAVSADFEAQYSCLYRRYLYRMRLYRDDLRLSVLDRGRVLPVYSAVDIPAMHRTAPYFEGKHDFAALATQETRSTVRTVYQCQLKQQGRDLTLHIAADGFLRNMVRAVVGTLLNVGTGKLEPAAIPSILASRDRNRAGENVPACGLYFAEAGYVPWQEDQG